MSAPRKDYSAAVEMYTSGISAPKIAKIYGISNTSMYKILKRRGCDIRTAEDRPRICSVDGCEDAVKANGLCARHDWQMAHHGRIISTEKLRDKNKKCCVPGCGRKHRSKGYCIGHLQQYRKHGGIISSTLKPRNGMSCSGEYALVKKEKHPMSNRRGYAIRSHLVWEKNTGHMVVPPEVIHHKNGNKQDDRFENLELFLSDSEHQSRRHRLPGHFGVVEGGVI